MKKLFLFLAFAAFNHVFAFAQTKYEMVIEKTDGSEVTINVEEIIRTYFREIDTSGEDPAEPTEPIAFFSCPDESHPHLIDLGLPSGTKWACCNVGASKPKDYGSYYAWGETEEKEYYDWSTYIHCDGTASTCHNIGSDIAGTQYDVAHVKWGGSWLMPNIAQVRELFENCSAKWTTENGVTGCWFTGKNGGQIFIPAAGYRAKDYLDSGYDVRCWTSSPDESTKHYAYDMDFRSANTGWGPSRKDYGKSVRPIQKN